MRIIKIFSILILLFWFQTSSVFGAEKRIALIIGNSNYQYITFLNNPANDAKAVAEALEKIGFAVTLKLNQGINGMKTAIRNFGKRLHSGGKIALFYYAGHGIQRHGENYLVPIDVTGSSFQKSNFVSVSRVINAMKGSNPSIIILDACRNDPFSQTRGFSIVTINKKKKEKPHNGLVRPTLTNPSSTLIAFATQPGKTALDVLPGGKNKNHSPYTYYLLKHIQKQGLSLLDFFNEVGRSVKQATNGKQEPWVSASPIPRICLVGGCMNHIIYEPPDDEQFQSVITLEEWQTKFSLKACRKDYTNVTCEIEVLNQGPRTKTLSFRVSRSPVLVDTDGNRHIAKNVEINGNLAYGRKYYLKQRIRRGQPANLMIYFNRIDRYLDFIPLLEIEVKSGKKRNKLQTIRFKEIDLM